MVILFFKAASSRDEDADSEPLPDKMRRILLAHIKAAKTDEERERAEKQLRKLDGSA